MSAFVIIIFVCIILLVVICGANQTEEYRKQVQTVTTLDRGTWSERDLIPKLINHCGIESRVIFHDLYLRRADGTYTQLDLVVPTSQGIIVFEVKDYSGWIFGSEKNKYWMQILAYGDERHQFYNPIWQNRGHIEALRELLPHNPGVPIYNVVVFYGHCEFKDLNYDKSRASVIYDSQVVELVNRIKSLPPACFGDKWEVVNVLAKGVRNGRDPQIRQSQIDLATRAKANGSEIHTYSSSFWRWP